MPAACAPPRLVDDFNPPFWLRNPHVQSTLASTFARRAPIIRRSRPVVAVEQELLLDCGDGVRLQCFRSSPPGEARAPIVVLHGWEGSAQSLYVLSLAQQLFERSFDVLRLNLLDHGDTHHLNRELFHSCRLADVIGALRAIQQLFPGQQLQLAGFSLGGNFMLRAAAAAASAGLRIACVIAVSPVLEPKQTLHALESAFWGYQAYFVRKWMRSLLKKQAVWPGHYDFAEVGRMADLRRMTAELVRRFTEFPSLDAYLEGYSITGGRIDALAVPARIITARDDPIIPVDGLRELRAPSCLQVMITRRGGHCGFLERLTGPTWVERRIVEELICLSSGGEVGAQLARV
jgi:predicted alpha/beta-fold hydrolase